MSEIIPVEIVSDSNDYTSDNEEETIEENEEIKDEWENLKLNENYEINKNYPHQIRNKKTQRILAEHDNGKGYLRVALSENKKVKFYYKHKLIAEQFIPNPNNLPEADHIDKCRLNNHIENLRWVTQSQNQKNKTGHNNNVVYEYFDTLDDEAIEVIDYGKNHVFEFYYYSGKDDAFYFFNGVKYRKLHVNIMKKTQVAYVIMLDINNNLVKVCINKFKKIYGIEF